MAQEIPAGVDTLPMSDGQRFSGPESERPFGVPAQRTPVVFDPDTGGLRIGEHVRRVEDPSETTQVYGAYLSLLYAVRGAKPGEQLPLRAADLEALLLIVGDDPETIEKRLIGLMGCTAEEAKVLGGILLRHRKKTAALGVAASLLLGGSLASGIGSSDGTSPDSTELVQSVSAETRQPSKAPTAAPSGTLISGITSPGGMSVVVAPASGGGTTTPAAVPVAGGASSSDGGGRVAPAAPTRAPRLLESTAPVVAEKPVIVAEPTSPVEVEPVDRDLPPAQGRPIGGTVGGGQGDGSRFDEPAPVGSSDVPVVITGPVAVDPAAPGHLLKPGTSQDAKPGTSQDAVPGATPGAKPDTTTPGPTPPDMGPGTPVATPPGQAEPDTTTPGKPTPDTTTPGEAKPDTAAPGKATPGEVIPGETTPGKATPGKVIPGETTPGKATPGKVIPGETTPGKATPGKVIPGETTPDNATPPTTAPGKTVVKAPAPTSPSESKPGRRAAQESPEDHDEGFGNDRKL